MPGLRAPPMTSSQGSAISSRLSIDQVIDRRRPNAGSMTVPEVLDFLDEQLPDNPGPAGGEPLVDAVHIVHITKSLPGWGTGSAEWLSDSAVAAAEPSRRGCWREDWAFRRWPAAERERYHAWMANVVPGDPDETLGPILPNGLQAHPEVRRRTGPSAPVSPVHGARRHGVLSTITSRESAAEVEDCDHPKARGDDPESLTGRDLPSCWYPTLAITG